MSSETTAPRGWRLLVFRLAAWVLIPAAVFVVVEGGLRLAGVGAPTGFLMPVEGRVGVLTTNPKFGWRFFPPRLARAPVPFELAQEKPEGTYRIFLVGGSAARGTPDPAFGVARLLEAMLESAWPDTRFEVKNAAMTAASSHVVLPIVRDLAGHEPDLFVVYLGNNEVVGPYGAATIFSPFSPDRRLIRAALALKTTRLGQLLDRLLGSTADRHAEWRGMEMFLEQRVAADDPRLQKIYEHFGGNLIDLVDAARDGGAEVLLSTVATNLVDQPPFASLHAAGWPEAATETFNTTLGVAAELLANNDPSAALSRTEEARQIDDAFADVFYLRGEALLRLDRPTPARDAYTRARDLDALRFRADSRINAVVRNVARQEGVPLVDAERYFRDQAGHELPAPDAPKVELPGHHLFHEHVHLNFEGNYVLARLLFKEIRDLLPESITQTRKDVAPPSLVDVAGQVAFTPFDALDMEREILEIVSRPPFVGLRGHAADLVRRRRRMVEIRLALDAEAWRGSRGLYERRLASHQDDLDARRRFATLLTRQGDAEAAVEQWRWLVDRLPGVHRWRDAYALALSSAGRVDEAVAELERLLDERPQDRAATLVNLGAVYERAERRDEAETAYRRAMTAAPDEPRGLYNLATLKARDGDLDGAVELFRELVERHPDFAPGHHNLGVALERRGELDAAAASYRREIEASPQRAAGHTSLGLVLERQGETQEALGEYLRALELEPAYAPAHFNLADLLLALGRAAEAAAYYERGLILDGGNLQARFNWSAALVMLGRRERAAEELRGLLRLRPDDPETLTSLAWLLATSDADELRDLEAALELAGRAAEVTQWQVPAVLRTLATVQETAGRTQEARATLEKGLALARQAEDESLIQAFEERLAALP